MPYAELHAHSAFSFLDGSCTPAELVGAAADLGYEAVALTDHDGVYGSMELAQAAKTAGLRAIHGTEITLDDGRHLTLLVRDARGWRGLCRLLTKAHAHTRLPDGGPYVDTPRVSLEDVEEHAEGLVCLSGCARDGVRDEPTMRRLLAAFGPDAFRVELQRPFQRHDRTLNRGLASLAARLGVPTVATGDVHAHTHERAQLQDVFVAIREHTTLDASEPLRRGNHAHVLASPAAMAARFADHPEAVREAEALAETLTFDLTEDLGYRYPGAEDGGADRRLAEVCHARFDERYPGGHALRAEAAARLEEELRLIAGLGLSGFFNLHHELLELAREVALEVRGAGSARALLPPGRGRGSSVSSIVCYLTGLSHVDPVANKLLLGRFLNEEITSLPDIDLDFPRDVREVLIPRIHERYGRDRSALVAAFPTYRARGSIREIGKALGLPPGEIERVARGSEAWANAVDQDVRVALGEERVTGRWAWLARLADEAHELPRHLSQHSGGMIVATRPLVECCPVVPAAMAGRQMVQWDKDSCSDAGFLKIDLLGLGMLSAVERTVSWCAERRGETLDLSRIPYDDPATFRMIQEADTTGVFQIESRAQMGSLRRTRPANLDDLTVQVAIVRPGPIVGGAVNPYIAHRQRLREDPDHVVPYDHPSLEAVLGDTLGTIIFQDQVIEVAMAFAGFTPGEAEGLRRAMSRKRSAAALQAHHDRFVRGAMERFDDVDEALAEKVWTMVSGFSGFGFPKAHGAAFGLLAYQSTWLRVHRPLEFLVALLDEQPMGFYPPDSLAHEAQRRGITVLPPDINRSEVRCTIEEAPPSGPPPPPDPAAPPRGPLPGTTPIPPDEAGAIRIGLGYVLGVRSDEVEALVAAREEGGPFRSVGDLASRAGAGRAALEQLAWSGACDALVGGDRRRALWELGVAAPGRRTGEGVQLSLPLDVPAAPALQRLGRWDAMVADYATTGVSARVHPLGLLREGLEARGCTSTAGLARLDHKARVRIGGFVVARQRPGTAKGVCFLLLEDEHGTVNVVVPPDVYERDRLTVRSEPLVVASGRVEKYAALGGAVNVVVTRLEPLHAPAEVVAEVKELGGSDAIAGGDRRPGTADPGGGQDLGAFREVGGRIARGPYGLDELELARRRRDAAEAAGAAEREAAEREAAEREAAGAAAAGGTGGSDFRAVAPPVQSFTQGRRR